MCFCEGTRIRTPEGVAEVQDLRVGDRVVTGAGVTCEISWIGRRGYITSAIFLEDWERLVPVRIEQGALGDGMPCNDLLISPDHAVCLENSLVPVRHLLNGDSIAYFDRNCSTALEDRRAAENCINCLIGVGAMSRGCADN